MSAPRGSDALDALEIWLLTGSQTLYGDEILRNVGSNSEQLAAALNEVSAIPVRIVQQPVLTEAAGIHRQLLAANSSDRCIGVIAWMHTFSPAKMWQQCDDVSGGSTPRCSPKHTPRTGFMSVPRAPSRQPIAIAGARTA